MLVAVAVLLGIVALLAAPLEVAFRLEGVEAFAGRLTFRWLFGLVRVRVPVPGARRRRRARAPPEAREGRARGEGRGGGARILAALRERAFRSRVRRLVEDLVRAVHPSGLRLRMRLGLGDPADTGRLFALLGPLGARSRLLRGADVWIEPEFVDPVLDFRARGRLRVIPLQVLAVVLRFALAPASIRAFRVLRSGRA